MKKNQEDSKNIEIIKINNTKIYSIKKYDDYLTSVDKIGKTKRESSEDERNNLNDNIQTNREDKLKKIPKITVKKKHYQEKCQIY